MSLWIFIFTLIKNIVYPHRDFQELLPHGKQDLWILGKPILRYYWYRNNSTYLIDGRISKILLTNFLVKDTNVKHANWEKKKKKKR